MNAVEVTFDQVLDLARHLPQPDRIRLISQLAGDEETESAQPEPPNPENELIEPPPGERSISDFISPEDAEMAAATASLEAAWKNSGMTTKELLEALDESRKRVALREFGDLLNIQQ